MVDDGRDETEDAAAPGADEDGPDEREVARAERESMYPMTGYALVRVEYQEPPGEALAEVGHYGRLEDVELPRPSADGRVRRVRRRGGRVPPRGRRSRTTLSDRRPHRFPSRSGDCGPRRFQWKERTPAPDAVANARRQVDDCGRESVTLSYFNPPNPDAVAGDADDRHASRSQRPPSGSRSA